MVHPTQRGPRFDDTARNRENRRTGEGRPADNPRSPRPYPDTTLVNQTVITSTPTEARCLAVVQVGCMHFRPLSMARAHSSGERPEQRNVAPLRTKQSSGQWPLTRGIAAAICTVGLYNVHRTLVDQGLCIHRKTSAPLRRLTGRTPELAAHPAAAGSNVTGIRTANADEANDNTNGTLEY